MFDSGPKLSLTKWLKLQEIDPFPYQKLLSEQTDPEIAFI